MGNILSNENDMNRFMLQGICLSPPLASFNNDRTSMSTYVRKGEPSCQRATSFTWKKGETRDDSIDHLGYYHEMHKFEMYDYTHPSRNPQDVLKRHYADRINRIKHCNHSVPPEEVLLLFK